MVSDEQLSTAHTIQGKDTTSQYARPACRHTSIQLSLLSFSLGDGLDMTHQPRLWRKRETVRSRGEGGGTSEEVVGGEGEEEEELGGGQPVALHQGLQNGGKERETGLPLLSQLDQTQRRGECESGREETSPGTQ